MGEGQDTAQDRVTIQEAALRLGVKEDAIRKRIQRGSMRPEKAEDGRVYVWVDKTQDTTQDATQTTQDTAQDERLEDLREQVGYLRRQLDEEREARRRADTIIAQLARATEEQARTIRELEASQEHPETAETVEEAPEGAGGPLSAAGAAREELVAERALREMAEATLHEGMAEERRRREAAEGERDELRRQLNARSRQQEAHGAAEEQQGRGRPQSATGGAQEGVGRRLWRRVFGS